MQVRRLNYVVIDEPHRANTRAGQVNRRRGAQATSTDDQHASPRYRLLPGQAHNVELPHVTPAHTGLAPVIAQATWTSQTMRHAFCHCRPTQSCPPVS